MHVAYSPELKAENERHIAEFIGGRRLELLAAWGETIMARSYLRGMLRGIVGLPEAASCNWRSIGDPLKERPSAPPREQAMRGHCVRSTFTAICVGCEMLLRANTLNQLLTTAWHATSMSA